jgi:N-acetylglucosaminyldiphosphoundecaprenol N-acetyl-beta-D-mannosaminyltransferase
VVTPNVNHVVLLSRRPDFRAAYRAASLTLVDGAPLLWASRLLGRPLNGRVAGSDLGPAVFRAASRESPLTVFLFGARPGVAERARVRMERPFPNVQVVGTYSPPFSFEKNPVENEKALAAIAASSPELLVVGLGSPKQELWVHEHRHEIRARVALCIGATIDFLAGERNRAPRWMQQAGIEWVYRVAQEPRRLGRRYFWDAVRFPPLVLREIYAAWNRRTVTPDQGPPESH